MKNKKVEIIGCDFNNGDDSWVGKIGVVKKVIESGWCEGCVEVKFDDGDEVVFFKDEVKVI